MLIHNANLFVNNIFQKGLLVIKGEIIEKVSIKPSKGDFKEARELNIDDVEEDCNNGYIIPGLIDVHTHLRDLDQNYKESFETGTLAALSTGITTVFNMPNTSPPVINFSTLKNWINKARNHIFVDVGFISGVPEGIDGNEIKKIMTLKPVGFKIYPHSPLSLIDWTNPENLNDLYRYSADYSVPIFIHPAWPGSNDIPQEISRSNNDHYLKFHSTLHPVSSEVKYIDIILKTYFSYCKNNQDYLPFVHFCHISSIESFDLISSNITKYPNLKISFEVSPHHLLLSNNLKPSIESFGKVLPPLRSDKHRQYLYNRLCSNEIPIIASDHAPHSLKEKKLPFQEAPSGFPEFETYPLLFLDLIINGKISPSAFINSTTKNPAVTFGLVNRGCINEKYIADMVVFKKAAPYRLKSENFLSKAKFSPYENRKVSVKVDKVIFKGKIIDTYSSYPKPMGIII